MSASTAKFFREYARHRAREGRAVRGQDLRSLPYVRSGPLARQWAVRARSFELFVDRIVNPMAVTRSLHVLDIGAGNGWLAYRLAGLGHCVVALDIRDDDVDGLGAAQDLLLESPGQFQCVNASFEALPFGNKYFDIATFNASLHYATDLGSVLVEAIRVTRPGGAIVILDSPFYASEQDGKRMVAEKHANGAARFGDRASVLLSLNFIEFLTRDRLEAAADGLSWSHHRARYPLWYEMRPLIAWFGGKRRPSRFDVWSALVP